MVDRANLPHKAIIHIGIAVHEVLRNGDLDPIPASEEELARYDIGRQAYRTFNSNTQIGNITSQTQDVTVNLF